MPSVGKPSVPRQVLIKMVMGPQQAVLLAKFDLSIHLKNKAIELQATDCKGNQQVMLSVSP